MQLDIFNLYLIIMEDIKKQRKYGIYILSEGKFYVPSEFIGLKADGVALYTEHTSIVIDTKNLENEEITWAQAMGKAYEIDKTLPDRHEVIEIMKHIRDVNKVLYHVGGQKIYGCYWTRDGYSISIVGPENGDYGNIINSYHQLSNHARAVNQF